MGEVEMAIQYLRVLSEEDLKKIHNTSLAILENTGMLIEHHKARKMLQEAGARVDHERKIVKFPPELVEKSLENMPRTITYAGRNPENDMILKVDGDVCARTSSGAISYVDLRTGDYRGIRTSDVKEWAILADALPNINLCASPVVKDVRRPISDTHSMLILLENQRKPITCSISSLKDLEYQIEMALAIRGSKQALRDRPPFRAVTSVVSPLFIPELNIDILFLAGEYGIPVKIAPMANAGATAPLSLAGTLAQSNAEELGAITLVQVINVGAPMPYNLYTMSTDMLTGLGLTGGPENAIMLAALAQLGRELYALPVELPGLFNDGSICEQTLVQKASNALVTTLAGGNELTGAGSIDAALAASPVQLVIDDEVMGVTRSIWRGIEVNDDNLGLDAIARVGPRGNFLTDKHTLRYLRRTGELFRPTIFDRDPRGTWLSKGAKGLEQKARERALAILEEHEVEPLPDEVMKELRSIARKADKELAV